MRSQLSVSGDSERVNCLAHLAMELHAAPGLPKPKLPLDWWRLCKFQTMSHRKGHKLKHHGHHTKKASGFDWGSYLDSTMSNAVPISSFKHVSHLPIYLMVVCSVEDIEDNCMVCKFLCFSCLQTILEIVGELNCRRIQLNIERSWAQVL